MRTVAGIVFRGAAAVALAANLDPATQAEPLPAQPLPSETSYTIVLAGDTGLNASYQPVFATFGTNKGQRIQWAETTAEIASAINGDINFANLETVVTDRNDLRPKPNLFVFRSHPDGVRHLVAMGLNAFSTANNHALDFGLDGARETLKHLNSIGVAHAGLGANRAGARTPRLMLVKNRTFAVGALGIAGIGYASPAENEKRPGQLTYSSDRDFAEAVSALVVASADYRIMSVHYGHEFEVKTAPDDHARFNKAIAQGVDLIVGHHPHVVGGVEIAGDAVVFYGMGNFLHLGTQDMTGFDICRDYGLIARVHLTAVANERPKVRAIEALPIAGTEKRPRRMSDEDSRARLHVLNHLAEQFGDRGVRFAAEPDGTGLYCTPDTIAAATPLGQRCRATKLISPPADLAAKIESACDRRVVRVVVNGDSLEPEFAPAALKDDVLRPWP